MTQTFAFSYSDGVSSVTSANLTATAVATRFSYTFTAPPVINPGAFVAIVDGSGDPTGNIIVTDVMLNVGATANAYTSDTPGSTPQGGGGAIYITNTTPTTTAAFIRHYSGVLVPDSTRLASAMTNSQLFQQYVAFPVSNPTYIGPTFDAGFTSSFTATILAGVLPARGSSVSPIYTTYLDSWNDGAVDQGLFVPFSTGTATGRYFRAMIVVDTSVPAYVTDLTLDLSSQTKTKIVNQFAVDAAGTVLLYPGTFHSPPNIQITPTGGGATSGAASNVTATQATIELFAGQTEVSGTCSISLVGG